VPYRLERWRKAVAELSRAGVDPANPQKLAALFRAHPELGASRRGTIGAVACDAAGNAAVATSTGGVLLKLPGRVGDTPIPGAGSYASAGGAASATGRGELMMRALTTKAACERMDSGEAAQRAAEAALAHTAKLVGDDLGLITVDVRGRVGAAHATRFMPHAFAVEGQPVVARLAVGAAGAHSAP